MAARTDWAKLFEVGYCLIHGRTFPLLELEKGTKCQEAKYVHPLTGVDETEGCPGPFAFIEPPPPLTEEEWETIFEEEHEHYAY